MVRTPEYVPGGVNAGTFRESPASTVNSPPVSVPLGVDASVAPEGPTAPAEPAGQVLGLPALVAQAGLQFSAPASILAPGPVKSVTLPVRDQPAGPPRKSLTVTVCSEPVEAPPLPKSTADSETAS